VKRFSYLTGLLLILLLLPCFTRAQEVTGEPIRIISYNIWNGFEENSRRETFIQWVNKQDPDIVALQELVGFTEEDLATLGATYGHPYVAILKEEGYPVGITSQKPIRVITKKVDGFWHGMLHAETYGLDLVVIHLSPFEWNYRLKEAQAITNYIEENKLKSVLVMGDFNAFSPFDADLVETHRGLWEDMLAWDKGQEKYRNMREDRFDYSVLSTFLSKGFIDPCQQFVEPALRMSYPTATLYGWQWGDPRLNQLSQRLDYILVSPDLKSRLQSAVVHNGPETDTISDHYPVSLNLK